MLKSKAIIAALLVFHPSAMAGDPPVAYQPASDFKDYPTDKPSVSRVDNGLISIPGENPGELYSAEVKGGAYFNDMALEAVERSLSSASQVIDAQHRMIDSLKTRNAVLEKREANAPFVVGLVAATVMVISVVTTFVVIEIARPSQTTQP